MPPTSRSEVRIEFIGGTYEGAASNVSRCSCCGRAVGAGGRVVSPFGEVYELREVDGAMRGELIGHESQMTLEELLGDAAA